MGKNRYAIGLVANAQVGTTEVENDFDAIYPWSDITSYNYDTGTKETTAYYGDDNFTFTPEGDVEVLTYIPEFYYKRYQDETNEYVLISKSEQEGFTKSEAFSIGRYMMSGNDKRVHSRSGQSPLTIKSLATFRTYATKLGSEFSQLDYHFFIIQLLYLVEYADYNSKTKLGPGITASNSSVTSSGGCDILGMKSGSVDGTNKTSIIYRGIEDIVGNLYQYIDGINIKDRQAYICYDHTQYVSNKFDGCYKPIGYVNASSNGYITKLGYDESNPLISLPTAVGGSASTYISNSYSGSTGSKIARVGGAVTYPSSSGLWYWNCTAAYSTTTGYTGARLLKTS